MESTDANYIAEIANIVKYAHSKGIEVGGYDLIVWTRSNSNPNWNALNSNKDLTGNSCIASNW